MHVKKLVMATIRVVTTNARLLSGKLIHGSKLKYNPVTCLALSDKVAVSGSASIDFGRALRTRGGCSFNVQEDGKLEFGNNVFLNRGCMFNCHKAITIGDGCEFGPNVLVYDHDHIFRENALKKGEFQYGEVLIGKNCWIGAGSIILRGTTIGEGSVIAAGSIVKGEIPSKTLYVQKRSATRLSIE